MGKNVIKFCIIIAITILSISFSYAENPYELEIINLSKYRNFESTEYSIYHDVLSYSKAYPFGDQHGRYTNVHETAHSIHNELRNQYRQILKKDKVNVLYILNGEAVVVDDPNITLQCIKPFIGNSLKSQKYKLYLEDQLKFWNEYPTYILDEWNCYILGAECAIDDFLQDKKLEKTNVLAGPLEFSIYALAMCLAIQQHDNDYWHNNLQFKSLIYLNLTRTSRLLTLGSDISEFVNAEQDRLKTMLLKHEEASKIRILLKNDFNSILLD